MPDQHPSCLHCRTRPQAPGTLLGLCETCEGRPQIRLLYLGRKGRPPTWGARLDRLAERARLRLPLFPHTDPGDDPCM